MAKRIALFLILAPCLLTAAAAQEPAAKKPFGLEEMLSIPQTGAVALSPSGDRVAFELITTDWAANAFRTDVWLAETAGGRAFAVTAGRGDAWAPAWSPDGKILTFISSRTGSPQVHALRPGEGEAEPLFQAAEGVVKYAWSPDGRSIAFLTPEPAGPAKAAAIKAGFDAVDIDAGGPRSRLCLVDLDSGKTRVLAAGDFHVVGVSWAPDGSKLALVHSPRNLDQVIWNEQALAVVGRDGTGFRDLDFKYYGGFRRHGTAVWSPDGRYAALDCGDVSKPELSNPIIQAYDFEAGQALNISGDADYYLYDCRWAPDGYIYFVAKTGQDSGIFRLDPVSREVREISHRLRMVILGLSLSADGRTAAFAATTPERPDEIYVGEVAALDKARRLTDLHPGLDKVWVGRTEEIVWTSGDGLTICGNIVYPIGYEKGKAYPTLTLIHGGPAGDFDNSFNANYYCPAQYFAGQGYLVFLPNDRGSIGWGGEFMRKVMRDWGGGDCRDLLAGLDLLIARGLANKDKLVVWGGSYGGFMTNWLVGHTGRFRAAHSDVGLADMVSHWGVSPLGRNQGRLNFGRTPFEDPAIYRRLSPLTYAMNVRTPLLLTQNEKDERVPVEQAVEFYRAVQLTGTPVELHVYPGEPHATVKPNHQLDKLRKTERWFKRYLPR